MEPKAHILNAAQVVFARHGFRQTSMSMVAEAAGLSRQALYHHFASKEALFAALVDALYEAGLEAARSAATRATGSAGDVIAGVLIAQHQVLGSSLSGSPFMAELLEESARQCGPAVATHTRRFDKELEALCARLIRERRLAVRSGTTARDVAELVTMASKGAKAQHMGDGDTRYARALTRMISVICTGLEAPPRNVRVARETNQTRETRRGRVTR